MHIGYIDDTSGISVKKVSLGESIWQFTRFAVVTGMIFIAAFFTLNFQSYRVIFEGVLNPEAQAKAQETLEAASGEGERTDSNKLLPLLPDKKEVRKTFNWPEIPLAPTDNRLIIPKLGKSVPIVEMSQTLIRGENWAELEKQIQESLKNGVVHYPGTAKPGEFGNLFITGHSSYYPWDDGKYKDVFATLGKLEVGDRYIVYYNQIKHVYQISEKIEVKPSNVDVLKQPSDQKVSTLMTCTPVGTTLRRLIIKAIEI